ncbi:MAG: tetratricopeptide repeat protein [Bacteroidetes bacterium]|nr:tetratricopeptide repeat protein [Bacteroidota bacterium]
MRSRLNQLIEWHQEDPSDSFIRFAMASEYVKLGELESGRQHFESLRESDPSYVGLYYHLGKLLERLERIEEAVSVYRDGIGIATRLKDLHARSELQSALLEAEMGEW